MSLAEDFTREHEASLRLAILQLLDGQADGSANDAVLYEAANAMDLTCGRETLRGHLFWLAGQGALHVLDLRMKSGLVIATLTERGHDLARGRSTMRGIARADGRS